MGKRRLTARWAAWMVAVVVFVTLHPMKAGAVEYDTFSRDSYGRTINMQPAYYPVGFVAHDLRLADGDGAGKPSPLNQPEDLYIDSKDELYIADTQNNRIVRLGPDGSFIGFIQPETSPLKGPTGVAVTDAGEIYVADNGNKRVVKLNAQGQLLAEYKRPDSPLVPVNMIYEPFKLAVDARGYMYVLSKGSYQGLLLLDPDGGFQGFFGTTATKYTIFDILKRTFYSEEQLRRQVRLLPDVVSALEIDREGFIYTTTSGAEAEQVKKLNFGGLNLFKDQIFNQGSKGRPKFADLSVDRRGIITVLEPESNTVSQYDPEGQLLFYWRSNPSIGRSTLGAMNDPVAVDSNSRGELFILDKSQSVVQRFKPTHFGSLVQDASLLALDGKYEESVPLWKEIHKLNAQISLAYRGLAQAAQQRQHYKEALALYRDAGIPQGYSDTFWQVRLSWFQSHFPLFANAAVIIGAAMLLFRRPLGRGGRRLAAWWLAQAERYRLAGQLQQALVVLRHPIDGFVDLRFRNKGGYGSAFLLLVLVTIVLLLKASYTGFSFTTRPPDTIRAGAILIQYGAIWLTWVGCNYLISSITQGEGRFKDVFVGSAYALSPVLILSLPVMALSNVLTLSEQSIYGFFDAMMWIWCALLVYWMIQALHNYTVGEALRNVVLSVLSALMLWLLAFIVYGMSSELIQFLRAIYQEVSIR